eukprot:UN20528
MKDIQVILILIQGNTSSSTVDEARREDSNDDMSDDSGSLGELIQPNIEYRKKAARKNVPNRQGKITVPHARKRVPRRDKNLNKIRPKNSARSGGGSTVKLELQ